MQRLYIVVRSDLKPGLQLAQACHAVAAFSERYPFLTREWSQTDNNLVVLAAPDEATLDGILFDLPASVGFREPDVGNELTAVAVAGNPEAKSYLRKFPLALAPAVAAE
jgi:DNA-binding transcriptional LysR family regulator